MGNRDRSCVGGTNAALERPVSPAIRRLLRLFARHRIQFFLAVLMMAIRALIPGALVVLIEQVLDRVLIERDAEALALMPFALIGLYAIGGCLRVGQGMLTRHIAWETITRLRREVFWHMLRLDARWHQRQSTGALVARMTQDVNAIEHGVTGIVNAIQYPLTLLVLLGTAAWMNPRLTLLSILVLPLVVWPIVRFGRALRTSSRASLDNMADLSSSMSETLTGMRTVATQAGEAERGAHFDVANEQQRRLQMRAFFAQLMPGPIIELIAAIGVGAVLWVGGQQVFAGSILPGELIAFMVALGLLNEPLKGISKIHSLSQQALAGSEALFQILDEDGEIPDSGELNAPDAPAALRFEGVRFNYGDGAVLQDLNFELGSGEVVAIVGASGSGKSTIANLIPRLFEPMDGQILLNAEPLSSYRLSSLRNHIAVVAQEPFLFNASVADNISFGTTASLSDIERAARAANADSFIRDLPEGYNTVVDEQGQRLSGGERQRICIARALLRDAPLLILDEATSALDPESEALVAQALERLMQGRTVLIIAHRGETIERADRVLTLENGRIHETTRGQTDPMPRSIQGTLEGLLS